MRQCLFCPKNTEYYNNNGTEICKVKCSTNQTRNEATNTCETPPASQPQTGTWKCEEVSCTYKGDTGSAAGQSQVMRPACGNQKDPDKCKSIVSVE